ncbi:hypothetical protein WN51_06892 [Melipona quadrifasciata]|uniref:Uncharacterized protein n=1 Tax=Melipona quadrifasciata TaxID=166423 RepID=A0A0M8ZNT0_9HYME|nr:hypothetical protein WN51_06892 [Melipona quadrifasciata]
MGKSRIWLRTGVRVEPLADERVNVTRPRSPMGMSSHRQEARRCQNKRHYRDLSRFP